MSDLKSRVDALEASFAEANEKLDLLETKLSALEEVAQAGVQTSAESITRKTDDNKLTGQTFLIDGSEYSLKYPTVDYQGRKVTEREVIEDESLRSSIFAAHPGLFRKMAMLLLMLLACVGYSGATSVTITAYHAEVVTATTRAMYPLQELLIVYRASTDGFEVQSAETRSRLWGGDVDSVTISGASTTAAKLAFMRNHLLEATTTGGYRVFLGRNNLEFSYNASSNRLDLRYGRNKQPLWFGSCDSLQSGPSGSANKIAYLRTINRYRAQDCLPTTSVATVTAGAAAGSSPTVTVTGDAFSGSISVTTGASGATTGTLATIALKITAPTGTRVVVTPTGDNSTLHASRVKWAGTTTTLVGSIPATALSSATVYTWDYQVVPY
jgi:hypothetical protein